MPVPERRPLKKQVRAYGRTVEASVEKTSEAVAVAVKKSSGVKLKLWYCKQCGYVVFREDPPTFAPSVRRKGKCLPP